MRKTMKTLGSLAIAGVAMLSLSTAQAWWGDGPWGDRGSRSWNNMSDWFGNGTGDSDFSMNMSGRGNSSGRGYGYNRYRDYRGYYPPPWAYGPPPGYAPPPAYGRPGMPRGAPQSANRSSRPGPGSHGPGQRPPMRGPAPRNMRGGPGGMMGGGRPGPGQRPPMNGPGPRGMHGGPAQAGPRGPMMGRGPHPQGGGSLGGSH